MGRGGWDDPRARATRGLRRPSLDARSWHHPSHPLEIARCGLADGLFEHPAERVTIWELFAVGTQ
jgi:hypothetical protein